jgi:transposase InsO family protein
MPWNARDTMSLREEFVRLANAQGANRRELCRRFGISPQTAYKWLARYAESGRSGLTDHSRRPLQSPGRTAPELEAAVVAMRQKHPAWGGRKISRRLSDLDVLKLAPSTVNSILHRHGLITPQASQSSTAWQRFEHESPNALWQADFKGYFDTAAQGRCSPLTVLDDHSRYNLVLQACSDITTQTVQAHLTHSFMRYGLPVRINFDNGAPWGSPKQPGQLTTLGVWLVQLGIRISHSRPYHPQTNGKEERFHRSLKAEVLNGRSFETMARVQSALDDWRRIYNLERPHEALQMNTPVSRYRPSARPFPSALPPVIYRDDDEIVVVKWNGELRWRGRQFKVSNALREHAVAVRARPDEDGVFDVLFAHHRCLIIDLNTFNQPS